MNKAFTRESEDEDEDGDAPENASPLPAGSKNYMTPAGFGRLKAELDDLLGRERPELVATIAWAAGNGDRSENGDYIYGKRRLREVDRRIRFLIKRLDAAGRQCERKRCHCRQGKCRENQPVGKAVQ